MRALGPRGHGIDRLAQITDIQRMLLLNYTPRRGRKKPKARARSRRLRQERLGKGGPFGNPFNFAVEQQFTSQTCGNREANAGLLGRLDGTDRPANHSEA